MAVAHIATAEALDGGVVDWTEQVGDEESNRAIKR
jgi:hypothetical protein